MELDIDGLTVALASRLAAIVPAGFHVDARDGELWYSYRADEGTLGNYNFGLAGTLVREMFDICGETEQERAEGVAWRALEDLQDYVAEASTDPWPGQTSMPAPFAQVRGELLHMWYGGPDIDSPVLLACQPLPLAEIGRSW